MGAHSRALAPASHVWEQVRDCCPHVLMITGDMEILTLAGLRGALMVSRRNISGKQPQNNAANVMTKVPICVTVDTGSACWPAEILKQGVRDDEDD